MRLLLGLSLCLCALHSYSTRVVNKSHEQRLMEHLLSTYDRKVRPVMNSSEPIVVLLGISLTMIMDVDERNQVLTTNIWLDQEWNDYRLKWNNTDFGGLAHIRLPCEYIWLPDILLYNSVDDHSIGYHKALAMVHSNGKVFWPPIVRSRSSCKLDITYFPFDDQICHMKFGSWAYDGYQLDVQKLKPVVDTRNLVQNGEWNLLGSLVQRNVKHYPCCEEPYPDITFFVLMERRNLYYVFNVIVPCLVLSLLTLGGFFLPPSSGEKITLGLTVLLAYSVFMLLIAENMPPTSEFAPLIGVYLTVVMALSSLSVLFAVIVLNLHFRGNTGVGPPRLILRLARCSFGRLACLSEDFAPSPLAPLALSASQEDATSFQNVSFRPADEGHPSPPDDRASRYPLALSIDGSRRRNGWLRAKSNYQRQGEATQPLLEDLENAQTPREMVELLEELVGRQQKSEADYVRIREWQYLALVLDRVLFFVFCVVTVVSTVWLLVFQPMMKHSHVLDFNSTDTTGRA